MTIYTLYYIVQIALVNVDIYWIIENNAIAKFNISLSEKISTK